jgi:hypothetical protein
VPQCESSGGRPGTDSTELMQRVADDDEGALHTLIGAPLQSQGIPVLLGRDVLQHCVLVHNGTMGSLSLSI